MSPAPVREVVVEAHGNGRERCAVGLRRVEHQIRLGVHHLAHQFGELLDGDVDASSHVDVLLAVVVVLGLWVTGIYNSLVGLRNRFRNAYAQIDVQLKRRLDLIPNLVETVKGYAAHERETLERVIAARGAAIAAAAVTLVSAITDPSERSIPPEMTMIACATANAPAIAPDHTAACCASGTPSSRRY